MTHTHNNTHPATDDTGRPTKPTLLPGWQLPRWLPPVAAALALLTLLLLAPIVLLALTAVTVAVLIAAFILTALALLAVLVGPSIVIHASITIIISISPPSNAHVTHKLITTLPAAGPVTLDTSGNAYVATEEGVKVFNTKNELTETFGKTNLQGTNPRSITITNNTGNIYIGEKHSIFGAHDGLIVFNDKHEYQTTLHIPTSVENTSAIQVAADNTNPPDAYNGDIYTMATQKLTGGSLAGRLYRVTPAGALSSYTASEPYIENSNAITGEIPGQVEFTSAEPIAVDPSGTLYTEGHLPGNVFIDTLAASGEFLGTIPGSGVEPFTEIDGLAINPSTSSLLVVANVAFNGEQTCSIEEFDRSGVLIGHTQLDHKSPCGDVAVESGGVVFVGGPGVGVSVFGGDIVTPTVVTEGVSGVGSRGVVVGGSVDPEGGGDSSLVARSRFEYGLTTGYGLVAGGVQAGGGPSPGSGDVGFGDVPVPVEAHLGGLEPNALYHYRLVGVNKNGSEPGEDATFSTSPALPDIHGESVSGVTQTSAILNARINPNNEDTKYHFLYGLASASGATPVGDVGSGFGDVSVGQPLTGLSPGTVYHYRVLAEHGAGEPVPGVIEEAEGTFTTLSLPEVPSVFTGPVEGVSQTSGVLTGVVDAHGSPTTYEFDLGTDTSYGVRIFGDAGQANGPVQFTAAAQSLQPATTYHYRIVASNATGMVYGGDASFRTPGEAAAVIPPPLASPLIATPLLTFPNPPTPKEEAESDKSKAKPGKHKKTRKAHKPKQGKQQRTGRKASRSSRRGGR